MGGKTAVERSVGPEVNPSSLSFGGTKLSLGFELVSVLISMSGFLMLGCGCGLVCGLS